MDRSGSVASDADVAAGDDIHLTSAAEPVASDPPVESAADHL